MNAFCQDNHRNRKRGGSAVLQDLIGVPEPPPAIKIKLTTPVHSAFSLFYFFVFRSIQHIRHTTRDRLVPPDVHVLMLGGHAHVSSSGKTDFADGVKDLEMGG